MRLLGSRARGAIAMGVPLLALSLALGAGQAGASTVAARAHQAAGHGVVPASGVGWRKIFPINGWRSADGTYGTGAPSYAVAGGVVYLSGSVIRPSGTSNLFAVLPTAARPKHALYITDYTIAETLGVVSIFPNGKMYVNSSPAANAQSYTSLAAISFPAASMATQPLTLLNGWQSSQTVWHSGDPSYSISGGVVYLSGSLHRLSGSAAQFALLPKAARPAHVEYITADTFDGTVGLVRIEPSGKVLAFGGSAASFTSLADISYPVATHVGHALRLRHGWASSQPVYDTGDPSSSVIAGVVYLAGSLNQSISGNDEFAVLPTNERPSHTLFIKVYTNGETVGTVEIDPDGDMFAYSATASDAQLFTSLATISFPLKS